MEALQNQIHRDRVLIRKQVEDDILDERMAELNQLRVEVRLRCSDMAVWWVTSWQVLSAHGSPAAL